MSVVCSRQLIEKYMLSTKAANVAIFINAWPSLNLRRGDEHEVIIRVGGACRTRLDMYAALRR